MATSRESKTYFGLPGYAPGTIAVMDKKRIQCLSNASQHVPIFNRFPVIQPVSSKVCHFSTFLHILALPPGYAPGTIVVNVTWMERGFNAGQMHRSIYPSIFNRLVGQSGLVYLSSLQIVTLVRLTLVIIKGYLT